MKKNILNLLFVFTILMSFSSCSEEEGTNSGGDSEPVATLYTYKADPKKYNPENDVFVRVAVNSRVKECFYFVQKTEDRSKQIELTGEKSYVDYVIKEGVQIKIADDRTADFYVTGLKGDYTISVVAVDGGMKSLSSVNFIGFDWEDLGKGMFTSSIFGFKKERLVQKLKGGDLYQIKSAYQEDWNIRFIVNKDNTVSFDKQEIGIVHKKYGMISFGPQLNGSKKDGKVVTLVGSFSVAAGSFGEFKEVLELP